MQVCDVIGISGTTVFGHTFSYYEITRNAAQLNPEVPVASQKAAFLSAIKDFRVDLSFKLLVMTLCVEDLATADSSMTKSLLGSVKVT